MHRNLLFYFTVLAVFGLGIYLTLDFGSRLGRAAPEAQEKRVGAEAPGAGAQAATATQAPAREASHGSAAETLLENLRHPLSVLLLQVIVVLFAARVFGALARRAGQPAVIGEMVAGIVLGPSLLGALSPGAQAFLFPAASMHVLGLLSQLGVILFMFGVGMELDLRRLRQKADAAVLISHASIVVPFFLGVALSLLIYTSAAPANISFSAFALFMGVAMSITAFPVLARIIEERGLQKTYLGSTVIACAAVDDVTAWCVLAVVVAVVKADGLGGAMLTITLAALFIAAMLFLLKPRAERLLGRGVGPGVARRAAPWALAFAAASALTTEVIGIHALLGAFLAGVCMPSHASLRGALRGRIETVGSGLLLPLFFAFTGLRTQFGLLDDWQGWLMAGGLIAVAVAGKLGGSMAAARWTGMSWQDSFSVGALMNTRGLIELIVLNLGYDLGILSPRVFAMMVLMALTTTFMTGPLLSLAAVWGRRRTVLAAEASGAAAA